MDLENYQFVVIGSGFFGTVIAERIANDLGKNVLIIEKRKHFGGNCYSEDHAGTGIHYHTYGTHIFHTSNKVVWDYIQKFTEFNGYYHQVLTICKNKVYQMPINLETITTFFNVQLKPYEVDDFLKKEIEKEYYPEPSNFEEKAISLVGRKLYDAFIKGYTKKQWQKNPKELPASILNRLPFRKNYNESYYNSRWQGIPLDGYSKIFKKMLENKKIDLVPGCDFFDIRDRVPNDVYIIYSGSIDQYFNYQFGHLEYRTVQFEKEVLSYQDFQGTSVMNYAEETIPYTRIHEPKHLHPERETYTSNQTIIIKEYSKKDDGSDPYYPINDEKNQQKLKLYQERASSLNKTIIGGRLGDYKYYDMHDTIAAALQKYETIKNLYLSK